jgi:hypothetical protein
MLKESLSEECPIRPDQKVKEALFPLYMNFLDTHTLPMSHQALCGLFDFPVMSQVLEALST